MRRISIIASVVALSLSILTPSSNAAIKSNSICKKAGVTKVDSGRKYTCIKQGKKIVWDNGVSINTPTPTPTPTFIEPIKATSFSNLIENSDGLTYWAWKLAQQRKNSSGKAQVEFVIEIGPNTKINFLNPGQIFQETANFYSNFEQVKKFHAVFYDYVDLNWAIEIDRKYSSNPRPEEVRRSCMSVQECNGGNAYIDGNLNGFAYISASPLFSYETVRQNGVLESHEYFHTIQVLPLMVSQSKGQKAEWMPDWIREGSAEWLSTAMYFSDYTSLAMYQISRSESDLYRMKYSSSEISKILSSNDGQSDNGWLAYNVGAKAIEALVVIKGVDSIVNLYIEGSKGVPFEQAFEKIYGISWETAKPILSIAISKKYKF